MLLSCFRSPYTNFIKLPTWSECMYLYWTPEYRYVVHAHASILSKYQYSVSLIDLFFFQLLSLAIISVMSVSLYRVVKYVGDHKNNPTPGFTAEEMQATAVGLYVSHAYFIIVFLYCCVISLMLIVGLHRVWKALLNYY